MMLTMTTQTVQAELLSCQTQLDQLSTDCMEVCPLNARETATANATTPCAVLALCDYFNKEVLTCRRCRRCSNSSSSSSSSLLSSNQTIINNK